MKALAFVCVTGLMVGACSTDPTSSEEYEVLDQELDVGQQQIEELTVERDELAALRERLETAEVVAPVLGDFAGVDPELVEPEQYESWTGVVELDSAVEAVNDPQLTELYSEHIDEGGFTPGPDALVLRLIELAIEPILEDR